jgi:hypothetical protein
MSSSCLDAETLAAWADAALTAKEREAAEAHAADCARCQALLAAMVRTAPSTPPAERWWARPLIGWLVPITALIALAIWIAAPATSRVTVSSAGQQARTEGRREPAAAPTAPASSTPAQPTTDVAAFADSKSSKGNSENLARKPAVPLRDEVSAPEAAAAESVTVAAPAPASPSRTIDGVASSAKAAMRSAQSMDLAIAFTEVVSSNPASRWRLIQTPGFVEHSTDGGATWTRQPVDAQAPLTAGVSPLPSICWFVGRGGTVLLTTDAVTWERLPFPEETDLVTIRATDGKSATVTTADGRTFTTTDGGSTWVRTPLQEIPAAPF